MFSEMRRKERQLSNEDTDIILSNGEYGILATIGLNGYPYGIPVNYIYKSGKIYFHCAAGVGAKVENIKQNPKVCFTVVGDTELQPDKFATKYESAIVFGEIKKAAPDAKQDALEAIIDKFSKGFEESGLKYIKAMFDKTDIYEIEIHHMTGKAKRA